MAERPVGGDLPWRSVAELLAGYRSKELSPVEVTDGFLARIEELDPQLHSFVRVTAEMAHEQAREAEQAYAEGRQVGPLAGVPISVKDAFHISGVVTTLGSRVYRDQVAKQDSGVVRRLRGAGGVFLGKTNTAEFGQSATTDNLLGPDTGNPWDPTRTPGGSSGGAAASVAAGLATVAVGSDGGGSIRIPAAFTGLYGLKPSPGVVPDEKGFRAMTDFVSAGPLASRVADARVMLSALAGRDFDRRSVARALRVGYCPAPEGRPVDPGVAAAVEHASQALSSLGHVVTLTDLPLRGWDEIFGPLVLDDEHRERGHLLERFADELTRYERSSLRAALKLDPADVQRAHDALPEYRRRIDQLFDHYDVLLTPTTAVPAFPLGQRPSQINGQDVDALWGAFPFAVPFNTAGVAAASLPCGLADGLPVGAQLVARAGREQILLDISEDLEEAVGFDRTEMMQRWLLAQGSVAR
ncbi:MAG: amidase [Intrasporangium sp.]|uniref:amidase n=1 Tax=Intrasporangium sp. TaxID=1925024 RepID=UPI00264A0ABD|nr:amidase [Intrasporangium sp.]MDN5794124.1 amidase [Intrasporangium sp.]